MVIQQIMLIILSSPGCLEEVIVSSGINGLVKYGIGHELLIVPS